LRALVEEGLRLALRQPQKRTRPKRVRLITVKGACHATWTCPIVKKCTSGSIRIDDSARHQPSNLRTS
jgi:hypothetical protein